MTKDEKTAVATIVIWVAALALCVALWVWRSSEEAKAFNRITGKNVSTWDAMFLELRVGDGD